MMDICSLYGALSLSPPALATDIFMDWLEAHPKKTLWIGLKPTRRRLYGLA
jgi:hypothetical protein